MKRYIDFIIAMFRTFFLKLKLGDKSSINGAQYIGRGCIFEIKDGKVQLGKRTTFRGFDILGASEGGQIKIGDYVYFGRYCSITAHENVEIGDRCRFGPCVQIFDHDHKFTYDGVISGYNVGGGINRKRNMGWG